MSISKDTPLFKLTVGEFELLNAERDKKIEQLENQIRQLSQREEKPMNRKEACEFLGISGPTFDKYRDIVTEYGVPGCRRYLPSELLKIKESLKRKMSA